MDIGQILAISTESEFRETALSLFRLQARECAPYREYLSLIGVEAGSVRTVKDIPFLPIEFFKSHKIYCGDADPEIVFTSSTTGGTIPSRHYMARKPDYEQTFCKAFSTFYGDPAGYNIYALLPGYLEREGSSLIYMIDNLIKRGNGGGFYLNEYEKLIADMAADSGKKILFGVSYALWELAKRYSPKLNNTIVMETGGMKGRREELPKKVFHDILCRAFGVETIHSEYGMAELSSQAYSSGEGIFRCPKWMKVTVRDLNDPFELLQPGRAGGINIIDLANIHSCAFIQAQDVGIAAADGSFSILGRADRSEIRGCNLLVQ